jgi:hypothetical protein
MPSEAQEMTDGCANSVLAIDFEAFSLVPFNAQAYR